MSELSGLTVGLALFGVMLLLMALRVPIAIAMFISGALGYVGLSGWEAFASQMGRLVYAKFSLLELSVIPLFLLMGQFATQGGLSRDLFRAATSLVGHYRGGLAMAAMLACALFGTVCGSSVATAATMAQVALPEMRRHRYSDRLATATLAVGGTLGILIPPSVVLVIYAILAQQNIAKLFAAAFIPGVIAAIGYCVVVAVVVRLDPTAGPATARASNATRWQAIKTIWPLGAIFVVVFGGIYIDGFFTPTEAAGVGAIATLILALTKGELRLAGIGKSFLGMAETCAMIFLIFLGADVLNAALALTLMPGLLAEWVGHLALPSIGVVAAILVFYVLLGSVMDELSMIMLTIPVFLPTVLGLDLYGLNETDKAIWFGILVLMVVEVGLIAPPVGLNVYVINGLAKDVPMAESYRGVMPFLVSDALRTLLILAVPGVALWAVQFVR